MNQISSPPAQPVVFDGPVGPLEGLLEEPEGTVSHIAVVCHPHPVYGGTMTNKVVHMLAKSFIECGAATLRFNYRGVGASAGQYDDGNGETVDTLAAIDWISQRWPQAQLWLAGFSFGGAVAARAAVRRDVKRLVTVAPAVARVSVDETRLPQCPWLLVQGDQDELVNVNEIRQWVGGLSAPPELVILPGVEHFFHGRLNELRATVVQWLQSQA